MQLMIALNITETGVFKVSNKHEIEEELAQAESQLATLCQSEQHPVADSEQMTSLREECSQLRIILEAMEASED